MGAAALSFRKLMLVALSAGAIAGLVLFLIQSFTIVPLIHSAETYENNPISGAVSSVHADEGWHPAEGWQRISLTAITTILGGIGFAATLFGLMALSGKSIDAKRGALWGLAGFICFSLAPALGLPPQPPGAAAADLSQRQIWWASTVIATAIGIWLITGEHRTWPLRIFGVGCVLLPHVIGAPVVVGQSNVPAELVRRFAIESVLTNGIFWVVVGTLGGLIHSRNLE